MNYTHASLFSGIGGAELAASWLGWTNVFHCEIQEFQRKVLEYWFPNSISYEDITKTDFKEWRGQIDVLTGGFPCQPFSMAGKRLGAKDDRYLWPHMLRAIREVQPTWVVCENVAGILSMVQPSEEVDMGGKASLFEENYRTREEQLYTIEGICQGLEQAGYSVQTLVIPACAVGAPHRRDRVWIIAHRTNARSESVQQRWQNGVSQPFLQPTPTASDRHAGTHKESNTYNRDTDLNNFFAKRAGKTSQLNPLFVAEMMGFPLDWLTLPFLSKSGEAKASRR